MNDLEHRISELEHQLELLRDELRDEIGVVRRQGGASRQDALSFSTDRALPVGMPRPFFVGYDTDSEGYYIFAPEGCVLINGEDAVIDNASSDNVALDIDPDDLPDYIYLHVSEKSDGKWHATFDGEDELEGAKYNVKVVRFGRSENDGDSYDILTSAVSLGESGVTGKPFDYITEIGDDEEVTHKVVNCQFMWDGVLNTSISDYSVSSGTTEIYLVAKQAKAIDSGVEGAWTFEMSGEEKEPGNSECRVVNCLLYELDADMNVLSDHRDTFMTLNSPHLKSYFEVKSPDLIKGSGNNRSRIVLDTTGHSIPGGGKIVIYTTGEAEAITLNANANTNDGRTVNISTSALGSENHQKNLAIRDFTYKDSSGNDRTIKVLSTEGVTLPSGSGGVTSVTKKANTEGLNINPTTGAVVIENTGVTGIKLTASGSNKEFSFEGTARGDYKTKDVNLKIPMLEFIDATSSGRPDGTIPVKSQKTADGNIYNVSPYLLPGDANTSIECPEGTEVGKVFGDRDKIVIPNGGSSYTPPPAPFDIENGKVVRWRVYTADYLLTSMSEHTISGTGSVYLHITKNSSGSDYSMTVNQTSQNNTDTHVQFKLYDFDSGGKVSCDYRPVGVLPLYKLW